MQITYATESAPGSVNEDYAIGGDTWAVLLDGATAVPDADTGCVHDVAWLVHHLAAAVARRLLLDSAPLPDLLAAAIEESREAHGGTCDLSNPDSPSSTISIARERGGQLDYLTLADSPIVIRTPDQTLVPVIDDRIAHLPGGRPYAFDLVRSLRNQPGGFWVAGTNPEAAYQAVSASVPFPLGTDVAMFSDGVSRLVEFYGHAWESVFCVLDECGPSGLIERVRSIERERPLPRGKQHDDATAILLTSAHHAAAGPRGVDWRSTRPKDWRSLVGM